ncbi:MAG: RNA-guided endonuclease IscB [Nostoc sp.]|uniref:RNA-guided endonuclease IscB n=1 Tax=Nostoc sp. TaxID=1180 RepID=UPI002FFD2E41
MSKVFVIDQNKRPLDPIHSAHARQLLRNKKAAVFRCFPFTIILKESRADSPSLSFASSQSPPSAKTGTCSPISALRLKIDPGAKYTGIALVNDATGEVVFAAKLKHRGFAIRDALTSRRQLRRSRRARKTRYRKPRFLNRTRPLGWLAPSLQSRVENIKMLVEKLRRFAPITAISQELVRFDMQLMSNPNIQGEEYQQGTLQGYETREYLLEKWGRQCAYCACIDVPFQVEHIHPRAKGGSNSISNLTLSCEKCNAKKGTKDIKDFLKLDPSKLTKILSQAKKPLADAAAVNTTRWALLQTLKSTGLPVETGSGGLTKFNRSQQMLEKTHWLDAACVGKSTPSLIVKGIKPLLITANGHGSRQSCRTDKFGFPSRYVPRFKFVNGFQTGDIVKAIVTKGKKIGEYIGRVAVRTSGSFNISFSLGLVQGISHKYCKSIHKKDGYEYGK